MIITNFNKWDGRFGNKLLGLNNLIQLSHYYKQDFYFNNFNGVEMFEIDNKCKNDFGDEFEILDINKFIYQDKDSIVLDNNKVYYLPESLFELFHKYNHLSTFEVFKFKNNVDQTKKMIGLHFRGSDFYLWDKRSILPYEYYKNSIDFVLKEINDNYKFILFTDDTNLISYLNTVKYLNDLKINYTIGSAHNFKDDFKTLSNCEYIISSPSTFCITASLCGKQNKKIIHNHDFVVNYKYNSNYYRDIFWKNLIDLKENSDYNLYKLI